MPELWPRNIIPWDDRKLNALGNVESIALYFSALEAPLDEAKLDDPRRAIMNGLIEVGLLERTEGGVVPTNRHSREDPLERPGRDLFKRAVIQYARAIVEESSRLVDTAGEAAKVGIGVITLPDAPEALSVAAGIMAEAEDQLRALAETASPDHGNKVRVLIFFGSAATPS